MRLQSDAFAEILAYYLAFEQFYRRQEAGLRHTKEQPR